MEECMPRRRINETEILEKMRKPIGRAVTFKYPVGEKPRRGVLKDRAIIRSNERYHDEVPYWDVADLIKFDGEPETWLRFGYYRMPKDRLNWASQTALTDRMDAWKRLMVQAAREKPWFRDLLREVMREVPSPVSS
jgi:hypothetical protein